MKINKILVALLITLISLSLNAQYKLYSSVFGGGGTVTGGAYKLSGSAFQPNTGVSQAGSYIAKSGFWATFLYKAANGSVLPVELTSFTSQLDGSSVILSWQTATEVNNYGFEVERSQNNNWQKIGFVQGHGNSNSPKEYSFTDKPNGTSDFRYRLKQIDFDGQYEYSPEVKVNLEIPADFSIKQNFPNPFNPTTKIEFAIPADNNVEIKVYNVLGMEVATLLNEHRQAGTHSIEFNASNLSSGIYFYKVVSGNYSEIKKMILLK